MESVNPPIPPLVIEIHYDSSPCVWSVIAIPGIAGSKDMLYGGRYRHRGFGCDAVSGERSRAYLNWGGSGDTIPECNGAGRASGCGQLRGLHCVVLRTRLQSGLQSDLVRRSGGSTRRGWGALLVGGR